MMESFFIAVYGKHFVFLDLSSDIEPRQSYDWFSAEKIAGKYSEHTNIISAYCPRSGDKHHQTQNKHFTSLQHNSLGC